MPTQSKPYLTPEQYLEIERKAEFKSEYHDGEMFPMDGERRPGDPIVENREAHRLIISNISARINEQLRGRQCRNYVAGMRVYIPAASLHPDVTVVCGEPQFADDTRDTLLNPNLIV